MTTAWCGRRAEAAAWPASTLAFRRIKSIVSSIMPAPSIHGHAVIDMVAEAGRAFTRRELVAAIESRFGAEARFHTCADEGLTADGLVGFLVSRGKLVGDDGALALDASQICEH